MPTPITLDHLKQLGFSDEYPNGEFYLFDESCARENEWCCIMCVYLPYEDKRASLSFNQERGLWSHDPKFYNSKWIEFDTLEELQDYIRLSKALPII